MKKEIKEKLTIITWILVVIALVLLGYDIWRVLI